MGELIDLSGVVLTFALLAVAAIVVLAVILVTLSMVGVLILESAFGMDLEDFYDLEKDSDNINYMVFRKVPLLVFLVVPLFCGVLIAKRHKKVSEKAYDDARCKSYDVSQELNYNNNLKSPFYQKIYDKNFKSQRMMNIVKQAQIDVEYNSSSAFEDDVERKIYQDEYIKAYSLKDDFQNEAKLKYERLYEDKQPSMISNIEFKKVVGVKK